MALDFHDRYVVSSGKPYFSGYDFLKKLDGQLIATQTLTTIEVSGFTSDEQLEWEVTYPNGTSATTYTTDVSSLAITFAEAGSGSVTVTSGTKSVSRISHSKLHDILFASYV